jgi:Bacterial type III secretion protein (HrpB1_HrpK)
VYQKTKIGIEGVHKMSFKSTRQQISSILFDILSIRTEKQVPQSGIPILFFLRAIRPPSIDIAVVLAWELLKEHRFMEAKSILASAEFEHPESAAIKAALASLFYFTGDESWSGYLAEAHRLGHSEEALIVSAALEAAAEAGIEAEHSLVAFQNPAHFVEVIESNHPELLTKHAV